MIGDLRASLYDLFGYLLPGFVATTAIVLVWHLHFAPNAPIPLGLLSAPLAGSIALLAAYLVGHLSAAMGNALNVLGTSPEKRLLGNAHIKRLVLLGEIDERLHNRYHIDATALDPFEKYAILDEEGMATGERGDRDVYIYREGFYRGMTVGAVLLSVAVAMQLLQGESLCFAVDGGPSSLCLTRSQLDGALFLSVTFAWAFFARARRFGRYRVERAAMRWLAATSRKMTP